MTDEPPAPEADTVVRRQTRRWVGGIGLAIVVAVGAVALLGGFNDVPVEKLPVIELGTAYVGNEVTTTVTGVYLSALSPVKQYAPDDGKQWLVVEATLVNTGTQPSLFSYDDIRVLLEGVIDPAEHPYSLVDLRDGGQVPFLQPGLPVHAAFTWQVHADAVSAGDDIIVGIFERYHVADDPLFGNTGYTNATPVVRIRTTIGAAP